MKRTVTLVGWPEAAQTRHGVESSLDTLFAKGHFGLGDRAHRRLHAALWLRDLYRQCHHGVAPGAQPGFGEAEAPRLDPSPARQSLYKRAEAAMGPEFGVLYQACCLNLAARPSLLCRALDRLADWRGL